MTPALICLLISAAQEPSITLAMPASPLPNVMAEISRQSGISHRISGPSQTQFVYVKVDKLSLQRTRDAIAEVTNGTWKQINGVWHLTRVDPTVLADREFRRKVSQWLSKLQVSETPNPESLETALRHSVTLRNNLGKDPSAVLNLTKLEAVQPEVRFFRRLIKSLEVNRLLSMKDKECRVFALKPTSLQHHVSANSSRYLSSFWTELTLHLDTLNRVYPQDVRSTWEQTGIENPLIDPYSWMGTDRPPTDFHLAVRRYGSILLFDLCSYDSEGSVHFRYTINSNLDFSETMSAFENLGKVSHGLESLTQPLKLAEQDDRMIKRLIHAFLPEFANIWKVKISELSQDDRNSLLTADTYDLLSRWPSRMLDQLAEVKKKQVVALVIDDAILTGALMSQIAGNKTLGFAIKGSFGFSDKEAEGFKEEFDLITIKPSSQSASSSSAYFHRPKGGGLARTVASQEDVLDAIAELAAVSSSYSQMMMPLTVSKVLGDTTSSTVRDYNFELLKFFGQFSIAERKIAKEGGLLIPLNRTSQQLRSNLQKLILERDVYHYHLKSGDQDPSDPANRQERSVYENEPTVWLSKLDWTGCKLKVTVTEERHPLFRDSEGIYPAHYGNVHLALANQELNQENKPIEYQGFYNGVSRTLDLRLIFPNDKGVAWRAYFHTVDLKSPKMTLDELPEALKEQIKQRKAAEIAWQRKNAASGDGAKPPPER